MTDQEQLDKRAKELLHELGIQFPGNNEKLVARKLVLANEEIQKLQESLKTSESKVRNAEAAFYFILD